MLVFHCLFFVSCVFVFEHLLVQILSASVSVNLLLGLGLLVTLCY